MNVYDCANELAKAMRESQEYKKLKEAKAALEPVRCDCRASLCNIHS